MTTSHKSLFQPSPSHLGAAVIQDLDVSAERLVHDVHGHVVAVRQVPQQVEDLVGHHAVLVVLGQPPDQLQQFLALLLAGVGPARLRHKTQPGTNTNVSQLRVTGFVCA